jgi:hypothetical protein
MRGAQSAPIGSQLRGNLILIMLASDERFDSAARRQSICEDITTRLTSQNHRHQISQRSLDLRAARVRARRPFSLVATGSALFAMKSPHRHKN